MVLLPVGLLVVVCWKEKYCFFFQTNVMLQSARNEIYTAECLFYLTMCCNRPRCLCITPLLFKYVCVLSLTLSSFLVFSPDRREAVLLPSLQQGFCRQVQSQGTSTDPFGCEKIPMQELLQNLLQDVSSAQAWGIWLLCSTLNWDTFPPPPERKTSVASIIFFFSKPRRTVRESHPRGFVPKTVFFFFS